MMDRLIGCVASSAGRAVDEQERINCHRNFTQKERHFGEDVWLSRKGCDPGRRG